MIDNPFERRATEYLRDDEAFLSVIAPEPLKAYVAPARDRIYDRLVVLRGTPGSGKSTLARLFEFSALVALVRNSKAHAPLISVLSSCGALGEGRPNVLACRLILENDYREIWEFPYSEDLKQQLLTTLIQARAVLVWTRQLRRAGVVDDGFKAAPADSAGAAFEEAGASSLSGLEQRARDVEREIFKIVSALVPPNSESLRELTASHNYRPFEAIAEFQIALPWASAEHELVLQPMIILDDAHVLHTQQLGHLQRWLVRRELRLARWILSRLDIEKTEDVLAATQRLNADAELPGITKAREITVIDLQSDRKANRLVFRRMAKDMASRYLRLMPQFVNRKIDDMGALLSDRPELISRTRLRELSSKVDSTRKKLGISVDRMTQLQAEVDRYRAGDGEITEDEKLAMLLIVMHRYAVRTRQNSLFEGTADPEPTRKITVDSGIYQGARFQLFRNFDRPYFYGIEDLCDASSENAEQFLRLAARFVDAISSRMVRPRAVLSLGPIIQHDLLRDRAKEFVESWNFPHFDKVRMLARYIAERCLEESLLPNAWLDAGANAYGVLQTQFDDIVRSSPRLSTILKFGLAYNAFSLNPNYECKNKQWCLIQLGGLPILYFGLTLRRGGFIEGNIEELEKAVDH
jgi:hypothetical protein